MKLKKGFIVKSKINGNTIFNHLLPSELYLISKITRDADNGQCTVKATTYEKVDIDFITQRF